MSRTFALAMLKPRLVILAAAALLPAVGLVGTAVGATMWGLRQNPTLAHLNEGGAILIFGARVREDGTASRALHNRTWHAFRLWKQSGGKAVLVCTGGGAPGQVTEAEASAHLLRKWGVPSELLLLDNVSASTRGNAEEAAKLLVGRHPVVGVSDPYHLWRCRREGRRFGLELSMVSDSGRWNHLPPGSKIRMPLREAFIIWRDFLREWTGR